MAIKTVVDYRGTVNEEGTFTGLYQGVGAKATANTTRVTASMTLSAGTYGIVVSGAAAVALALPAAPVDGQEYRICSVNSFTVSLTGTNPAHKINNLTTAVSATVVPGMAFVAFAGSPTNMWFVK